ncbi:MAG: ASPIC/UnbV domain-containing protein [Verrucomicrobiota bacterium]
MPATAQQTEASQGYLKAWDAIGKLLENGRSWSGNERNVAYLNTRNGQFADISGLSGLNHSSDSRAVGISDWDRDGDLDIWIRSRTSPRLRLLRNDFQTGNTFIAFKLEGTRSNADGIGSSVEVQLKGHPLRRRTLKAGEGYLSQAGKSLHFGLTKADQLESLTVRWPDGTRESFSGAEPGETFILTEGTATARPADRQPPSTPLAATADSAENYTPPNQFRIVPHGPLPLPIVPWLDSGGKPQLLFQQPAARLVTLWTSTCLACREELKMFDQAKAKMRELGVTPLCLFAEDSNRPAENRLRRATTALAELQVEPAWGLATNESLELFDLIQRVLLSSQNPLPVPSSFLIRPDGRLAAVYLGSLNLNQLSKDVKALFNPGREYRDLAVPFSGKWYVNPFPPDWLELADKMIDLQKGAQASNYLSREWPRQQSHRPEQAEQVTDLFYRSGTQLAAGSQFKEARRALEQAAANSPRHLASRSALVMLDRMEGNTAHAVDRLKEILRLQPDNSAVANNLAWILATDRNPAIRNPKAAIDLASQICEATRFQIPEPLDTLAAGHAAAGQFDRAIEYAEKARDLAMKAGKQKSREQIESRLKLYRSRTPFVQRP